jgi:hypothetical protein
MLALPRSIVMILNVVMIVDVDAEYTRPLDHLVTAATHTTVQILMNVPETGLAANQDIDVTTIGGALLVMISTNAVKEPIFAVKAIIAETQLAVTTVTKVLLFRTLSFS